MDLATQRLMMGAAGAVGGPRYIEDVFKNHMYVGNGSAGNAQDTGIDFAGEGGLVIIKHLGTDNHYVYDTVRGAGKLLRTNTGAAEITDGTNRGLYQFNNNGFSVGQNDSADVNISGGRFVAWNFRKTKGLLDIVTFTGNGQNNRAIAHGLGSTPGFIWVKKLNGSKDWNCYHRSLGNTKFLRLDEGLEATTGSSRWSNTSPTSTHFTVGDSDRTNSNGDSFVAYIWAHDDQQFGDAENQSIIKCDSYTGNGSSNGPTLNIGWEPQFLLIKNTTTGSTDWAVFDSGRGGASKISNNRVMFMNTTNSNMNQNFFWYKSTGVKITTTSNNANKSGDTYIYMAIRRPDPNVSRPAEVNTDLFNVSAGNSSEWQCSFDPDFAWTKKPASSDSWRMCGRYWDQKTWYTDYPASESNWATYTDAQFSYQSKRFGRSSFASTDRTAYMWRKSEIFDCVIYEGTGSHSEAIPHSLGTTPTMIWVKPYSRIGQGQNETGTMIWHYYTYQGARAWAGMGGGEFQLPPSNSAPKFGFPAPNTTNFYVGNGAETNKSGEHYVAMLWANKTGYQQLGQYTGNGSSSGPYGWVSFTPRVILIKKWTKNNNSSGNQGWFVFDTVSGITNSGNERPVELGTNAANTTFTSKNWIDIASTYFQIKTDDAKLNYSGEKYVWLAVA